MVIFPFDRDSEKALAGAESKFLFELGPKCDVSKRHNMLDILFPIRKFRGGRRFAARINTKKENAAGISETAVLSCWVGYFGLDTLRSVPNRI